MQPGDVLKTFADVSELEQNFDYHPSTTIRDGVNKFVEWFSSYKE